MNQRISSRDAGRRRVSLLAMCVAVAGGLVGCGNVRFETAPPTEPTPDVVEVQRRAAVDDALLIETGAQTVDDGSMHEAQQAELQRVSALAAAQAAALGGVYDSGLPEPEAIDDAAVVVEPADSAPTVQSAGELVDALVAASQRNRTAADAAEEPGAARLFASMSAAQHLAAVRLARLLHVPGPATPAPDLLNTEAGPEGLAPTDFAALVLAEDGARYAFEVAAAQSDNPTERTDFRERANLHGDRAEAWAQLGGIADTTDDPRQTAYELPSEFEFDPDAFLLNLEEKLGETYATLIGSATPGSRALLIDLLIDSTVARDQMGAPPQDFPGLPGFAGN